MKTSLFEIRNYDNHCGSFSFDVSVQRPRSTAAIARECDSRNCPTRDAKRLAWGNSLARLLSAFTNLLYEYTPRKLLADRSVTVKPTRSPTTSSLLRIGRRFCKADLLAWKLVYSHDKSGLAQTVARLTWKPNMKSTRAKALSEETRPNYMGILNATRQVRIKRAPSAFEKTIRCRDTLRTSRLWSNYPRVMPTTLHSL